MAGGGQHRAKRPHIYGDETRFRAAIARHIASGQELLDQVVGVHKRVDALNEEYGLGGGDAYLSDVLIGRQWITQMRKWFQRAGGAMNDYLQDQFKEVLPVLYHGLPPDTGKPRHHVGLDNGEPWLREAVIQLHQLQALLGVRRNVEPAAPAPTSFAELHRSGLVDEKVIGDQAKRMAAPRTPKQLSDAIGSAKELTEATLRGALTQLGEPHGTADDLPKLMRKWREKIGTLAQPDPAGHDALDKAHAALANLMTFLAEWRNAYGSGHGRTKYPPGLKARHARLAVDAAETCIRFIVTTMDDLQLLPPP